MRGQQTRGASSVRDAVRRFQSPASAAAPKSPGRYGSLSPGRQAAQRRLSAAAAAQAALGDDCDRLPRSESAGKQKRGERDSATRGEHYQEEVASHDDTMHSATTATGLSSPCAKISLPGRTGSRSVCHSPHVQTANQAEPGPREDVRLDHLTSMLASGLIQNSWGTPKQGMIPKAFSVTWMSNDDHDTNRF